jgi:membrane protease YdiL (CAAX protease family)
VEPAEGLNSAAPASAAPNPPWPSERSRRWLAKRRIVMLEVGAVLTFILGSTIASSGSALVWPDDYAKLRRDQDFSVWSSWATMDIDTFKRAVLHLCYVPIILFIIWRSGKPWSRFGLGKPKYPTDLLLGLCLWFNVAVLDALVTLAFSRHTSWQRFSIGSVPYDRLLLLLVWSCAVGFSEELTMRAYLIPRLETIFRSTWKSLFLSVVVFGFAHFYQSYVGVIQSLVAGLVCGTAFCLTRRIWPVAIAHAVTDFVISTHMTPFNGI